MYIVQSDRTKWNKTIIYVINFYETVIVAVAMAMAFCSHRVRWIKLCAMAIVVLLHVHVCSICHVIISYCTLHWYHIAINLIWFDMWLLVGICCPLTFTICIYFMHNPRIAEMLRGICDKYLCQCNYVFDIYQGFLCRCFFHFLEADNCFTWVFILECSSDILKIDQQGLSPFKSTLRI